MGMSPSLKDFASVSAVFFDFGDTLASIVPSREELFIQAAGSIHLKLHLQRVKEAYRIVEFHNRYSSISVQNIENREIFYKHYNEELCKAIGISSYFPELYPIVTSLFEKQKQWRLLSGVIEVLNCLNQLKIPLALVANWDRDLPALAERLGIRRFFACVIASQEAGIEKPDPGIFKLSIDRLALTPESDRILYVGNEYAVDVLGARGAGLTPILIDRDDNYPYADCIRFRSLTDWFQDFEVG